MKKKTFLLGLLLCATGAFAQGNLSSGIDLKNLDTSVKPGDDFYHYAAGGWLKSHPLDAEHVQNGAFTDLYEQSQKRIQDIILDFASKPQKQGTLGQKIGSLYNLLMDSVRLNREGWRPIKPTLDKIAAIKNRKEYQLVGTGFAILLKTAMGHFKKTGLMQRDYINNFMLNRISGLMFDIMVAASIAAIDLSAFAHKEFWLPLLLICVAGALITYAYNFWICRKLFPGYADEAFLSLYGQLTGTASTGIILLREIDPEVG